MSGWGAVSFVRCHVVRTSTMLCFFQSSQWWYAKMTGRLPLHLLLVLIVRERTKSEYNRRKCSTVVYVQVGTTWPLTTTWTQKCVWQASPRMAGFLVQTATFFNLHRHRHRHRRFYVASCKINLKFGTSFHRVQINYAVTYIDRSNEADWRFCHRAPMSV